MNSWKVQLKIESCNGPACNYLVQNMSRNGFVWEANMTTDHNGISTLFIEAVCDVHAPSPIEACLLANEWYYRQVQAACTISAINASDFKLTQMSIVLLSEGYTDFSQVVKTITTGKTMHASVNLNQFD